MLLPVVLRFEAESAGVPLSADTSLRLLDPAGLLPIRAGVTSERVAPPSPLLSKATGARRCLVDSRAPAAGDAAGLCFWDAGISLVDEQV